MLSALIPLPFVAAGAARNVGTMRAADAVARDLAGGRNPDGSPSPRGSNATPKPEAAPAGTPDAIPTAPPVPPEVVDAAMVHNLTLQQDVHEAGVVRPETAQIPRAGALQPVDRVIENRLAEKLSADFDAAVAELGDPRQAGLLEDRAPTQADVTAAAVERMRTLSDEQITDTPAPLNKPSTDPLLASIADRVSAVEATAGDMVVRTGRSRAPCDGGRRARAHPTRSGRGDRCRAGRARRRPGARRGGVRAVDGVYVSALTTAANSRPAATSAITCTNHVRMNRSAPRQLPAAPSPATAKTATAPTTNHSTGR